MPQVNTLMTGNEAVVQAALACGADFYAGYPITPSTEILSGWAKQAERNKELVFLQMEDETAAGFAMIGGVAIGRKAWSATAGMGHVLMQDPLSLAEAMRFPVVVYVGQRGGPSTGTVIYSQQELNLARTGGNGEGLRIIYAPSNLQELYDLTIKAFYSAWKYRFPTIILSDGYLGKTLGEVDLWKPSKDQIVQPTKFLQNSKKGPQNLRNTYSQEIELNEVLIKDLSDYAALTEKIAEAEVIKSKKPRLLVCAWGAVGNSAKTALHELEKEGIQVDLFRPITMKPFPVEQLRKAAERVDDILIIESAQGQFARVVKEALYGDCDLNVHRLYKPAMGIMPEEIESKIKEILK